MNDCTHRNIVTFCTEEGPVDLWACNDCGRRFVPIDRETALESALSDCVRHMKTAGSPEAIRAAEAAERVLSDA